MGFSSTKISFMIIDNSQIEIESASPEFFNFKKLSDFKSIKGGFSETDKNPKTFIFESSDYPKKFAEFTFK